MEKGVVGKVHTRAKDAKEEAGPLSEAEGTSTSYQLGLQRGFTYHMVELDCKPGKLGVRLQAGNGQSVLVAAVAEKSLGSQHLQALDHVMAVDGVGCVDPVETMRRITERGGKVRLLVERAVTPEAVRSLLPRPDGDPTILPPDVLRIAHHARLQHIRNIRRKTAPLPGILKKPSKGVGVKSSESVEIAKKSLEVSIPSDLTEATLLKRPKPLGVS